MRASLLLRASAVVLVVWGAGQAYGQCTDSTTTLWYQTTVVRLNGNAVRLNGNSHMTGDYYNWWYPAVNVSFYFNSTFQGNSGWKRSINLGGTVDWGFTPTLQTYGPGQYYQSSAHDAFTPYCTYNGQNSFSAMCGTLGCIYPPPWNSWAYINILRPTRPDYAPAGHPVFYLGPGISYDGTYSNNTSLIAGNPNGAPETPQWVFAAGSQFGTLNCTTCNQPLFTATKRSASCLDYSVVLKTSYNGFLSDPFYMFINGPNNTEASTCPFWTPSTWNLTYPYSIGWVSLIYYTTDTLCALDGPMTNYDLNETFGAWYPDYTGEQWTPAAPEPGTAGSNGKWVDMMWYYESGHPPTPVNPVIGCWPNCGTVKVQHAVQTFRVGTQSQGGGVAVQQDIHQRFLDHGEHDGIVTPVPQ